MKSSMKTQLLKALQLYLLKLRQKLFFNKNEYHSLYSFGSALAGTCGTHMIHKLSSSDSISVRLFSQQALVVISLPVVFEIIFNPQCPVNTPARIFFLSF